MRMTLRGLVAGSPLEPAVRAVRRRVAGEDANDRYDRQTVEIMRRTLRRDSNCIDIGCYRGSMLREMLRLAPDGRPHAFEPLPAPFAGLQRRFPGVILHNVALSDHAGEATFAHVASRPAYSGLLRREYDGDERVEQITVKVERLDDVIGDGERIDLIKIDVEGAECDVMAGAAATIARCRPVIIFEHGAVASKAYGKTSDDIYDVLHDRCGLDVSLMHDWLAAAPAMTRRQFNDQHFTGEHYYFVAHPPRDAAAKGAD